MNWLSARPQPETKRATVFSHTTHFSMLDEQGCRTCHKLDRKADYLASFKDHDPTSFTSNFSPLRTATCATCHIEGVAGDTCLLCHRYHVGVFKTRPVSTEMATEMNKPSEP